MKHIVTALFICLLTIANAAQAEDVAKHAIAAPTTPADCPFVETANISVSFNSTETDISKVATIVQDKIGQIEAIGKEKELTKLTLQSSNYSINVNASTPAMCGGGASGSTFQFYGSASFIVEPASRASEFLTELVQKGFVANLNVNSYRQCN